MYLKTEHEASASNVLTKAIPGFSKIFFPCIEQNRWLRQCQARDLCACFSNRPSELVGGGGGGVWMGGWGAHQLNWLGRLALNRLLHFYRLYISA